jgi:hypothetical protein
MGRRKLKRHPVVWFAKTVLALPLRMKLLGVSREIQDPPEKPFSNRCPSETAPPHFRERRQGGLCKSGENSSVFVVRMGAAEVRSKEGGGQKMLLERV